MNFELLEHTADIGFRMYGGALEELFANCAHALSSIIFDTADIAAVSKPDDHRRRQRCGVSAGELVKRSSLLHG